MLGINPAKRCVLNGRRWTLVETSSIQP
jgi:hypothetical protein